MCIKSWYCVLWCWVVTNELNIFLGLDSRLYSLRPVLWHELKFRPLFTPDDHSTNFTWPTLPHSLPCLLPDSSLPTSTTDYETTWTRISTKIFSSFWCKALNGFHFLIWNAKQTTRDARTSCLPLPPPSPLPSSFFWSSSSPAFRSFSALTCPPWRDFDASYI